MPVSPTYRTYVLEQLARARPGRRGRCSAGSGSTTTGCFFGLVDDDTLYLKVDDGHPAAPTRPPGMGPFRPSADAGPSMGYYEVPGDVLEDPGGC